MKFKDQLIRLADESVNNLEILIRLVESKNITDLDAKERMNTILDKLRRITEYITLN